MTHLNNQSINSKNDIINDKLINNQPENKQFNHLFTIIKPLDSQNKSSSSSNHIEYLHRKQKRKGRIKKLGIKPECTPIFYSDNIHSKFNQDNIKRKIKTHFHNFIIAYLNKEIKSHCNGLQKFKFAIKQIICLYLHCAIFCSNLAIKSLLGHFHFLS